MDHIQRFIPCGQLMCQINWTQRKVSLQKIYLLQNYKGPHILSLKCHYGLHTALTGLVYLDGDKKGTKEQVKLSESQQSFSFS